MTERTTPALDWALDQLSGAISINAVEDYDGVSPEIGLMAAKAERDATQDVTLERAKRVLPFPRWCYNSTVSGGNAFASNDFAPIYITAWGAASIDRALIRTASRCPTREMCRSAEILFDEIQNNDELRAEYDSDFECSER